MCRQFVVLRFLHRPLGLPTANGAVIYDAGYTGNPLVFCGCGKGSSNNVLKPVSKPADPPADVPPTAQPAPAAPAHP